MAERLGVDVGGTFTDFVLWREGQLTVYKLPSTPDNQSRAFLQGVADLDLAEDAGVIHGSTVATNAILERKGARTALLTTAGFADVLAIGRQNRPQLYALAPQKPPPLVPDAWRLEVVERLDPAGRVLVALEPESVRAALERFAGAGVESLAICFLFSFANPAHEQAAAALVRARLPDLSLSLSSEVLPQFREYERTSTTVINAYVAPLMGRYLQSLEAGLRRPLRIMQSNGGSITARAAAERAALTVLSGPAGGVVGAYDAAARAGFPEAITFDMGGTSTDVALCPGRIVETQESEIGGLPLRLPVIDIHTVGAGGGSLARVDRGGALRVGPESAGAVPGPACYGQGGTEPTVTDANLVLGRLVPDHFLGGRMRLDLGQANAALDRLAAALESDRVAAARGVLRVANVAMEKALRTISIARGYDPRRFTLVAFGGAGPLHACDLAAELRIPRVLIPPAPGVLSALGMLATDVVKDYGRTVMLAAEGLDAADLAGRYGPLEQQARLELASEGFAADPIRLERWLDLRYAGQAFELSVPWGVDQSLAAAWGDFHEQHQQRFGHAHPESPLQIVNLRLRAVVPTPPMTISALGPAARPDPAGAQIDIRPVDFGGPLATPLYARERLQPGHVLPGPAIVVQPDSTTVIPPEWIAQVDDLGNLVVERERNEA